MARVCLKCKYERGIDDIVPDYECPQCGAIYEKVEKAIKKQNEKKEIDKKTHDAATFKESLINHQESKHVKKHREIHLKESESIIAWGEGYIGELMGTGDKTQHNGALIVSNERVSFYRKGLLGEIIETIPLQKISSIERRSVMGHRTIRIHTSNDQLEFKTFDKAKEQLLVNAIAAGRSKPISIFGGGTSKQIDPMEALKRLGELKEMGVITEKEFEMKKNELLAKI